MTEIEFCEKYCGELTKEQIGMINYNIKMKKFLGVGRQYAGSYSKLFPMVIIGKTVNIINKAGYYDFCATDNRIAYKP